MFGRKRRQQERWFAQGMYIVATHRKMRNDVPAAAYLFARTLYNARPFIFDRTISLDQQIARVEEGMQEHAQIEQETKMRSSASLNNVDLGISLLAQRFTLSLLEAQRYIDAGSLALNYAFSEIVKFGAQYRELRDADYLPHKNQDVLRILAKQGHHCVAEVINAVRDDYAAMRSNPSTAANADLGEENEDVWSLIAFFDLRDEALSGLLAPHLRNIEAAVAGMSVRR